LFSQSSEEACFADGMDLINTKQENAESLAENESLRSSSEIVSSEKDKIPVESGYGNVEPITLKKAVAFRLKLVESSSYSQLSDSVFTDDSADLLQGK